MDVLYWSPPTAEQLSITPYLPEDFPPPATEDDPFEVWDESWDALHLFLENMTQWRTGPGGPIGLDYTVIYGALTRKGITGPEFDDFMEDIGTMERRALKNIHRKT